MGVVLATWDRNVGPWSSQSAAGCNISTTIRFIAITFGIDIHGAQGMNLKNVSDTLTLHLASPAGCHLSSAIYLIIFRVGWTRGLNRR